jgi:23S rRNA (adenine-N6)-dimethyltransferase
MVQQSPVGPGDLVFDLGAGVGALTAPLARTGARVIAIERDGRTAGRLAARMAAHDNVSVVTGDVLSVPLPRRPYLVVANIPFGITTALLRRLLDSPLAAADLVVALGAGRGLCAGRPGRLEVLCWQAAFALSRGPVLPAACFRPPPSVDAVVLRVRRRPQPPPPALPKLLRYAYRTPQAPVSRIVGRSAARTCGVDPKAPIATLSASEWRRLAAL